MQTATRRTLEQLKFSLMRSINHTNTESKHVPTPYMATNLDLHHIRSIRSKARQPR